MKFVTVNISQIVRYRKQIKGQKAEEVKLVEVDEVKDWEVKIKEI